MSLEILRRKGGSKNESMKGSNPSKFNAGGMDIFLNNTASTMNIFVYYIMIGWFIVNRGPNKRQIKPAGNNSLLQLALGEDSEDSEEDADFELNDDDDDDDEGAISKIQIPILTTIIVISLICNLFIF